ncbi:MAG: hypothetical protein IKD01_02620 [Oscillospiraceae bacterium]|nr:hypothetical protein [Oscillospiraceae bacterium]
MKKKTVRKLMKEQRKQRAQAQTPGLPMAMLPHVAKIFNADPGHFAGSPREFAWRELKRSIEERKRREARA